MSWIKPDPDIVTIWTSERIHAITRYLYTFITFFIDYLNHYGIFPISPFR